MGRGYSATRSHSARKTTKIKRRRSLSKMRDALSKRGSSANSITSASVEGELPQSLNSVKLTKLQAVANADGDSDMEESEDEDERVVRQDVLTKYKMAGKLVDNALNEICAACVEGASTKDLCVAGNKQLSKAVWNTMKHTKGEDGKKIPRGLSFPTTISVNRVLCNHAPFQDDETVVLKNGDIVKVHMGCHLDGYPVSAARTVVVGTTIDAAPHVSTQRTIDAARVALAGMIRMMRPGALNADITDFIHSIGHHYEVEPVEGVLSTRTKRWIPDSLSAIIARRVILDEPQQDVADTEIGLNQVWTLDVAFTDAPSYRLQESPEPCNVFRRNEIPLAGDPRLRAADEAIREVDNKFHCFLFTPTMADHPLKFRLGLTAMKKTGLLDLHPPLQCKKGGITTRFSCTVAITNKRVNILCGDVPLDDALLALLPRNVADVLKQPLSHTGDSSVSKKKVATVLGEADVATPAEDDDEVEDEDDGLRAKRKRR